MNDFILECIELANIDKEGKRKDVIYSHFKYFMYNGAILYILDRQRPPQKRIANLREGTIILCKHNRLKKCISVYALNDCTFNAYHALDNSILYICHIMLALS